jgi:hypothetical protein
MKFSYKMNDATVSPLSTGAGNSHQHQNSGHSTQSDAHQSGLYDPVLRAFVQADDEGQEEQALEELVQTVEGSVRAILRRKAVALSSDAELGADLYATTILRVLERLHSFKAHLRQDQIVREEDSSAEALKTEAAEEDSQGQSRGRTTITNFKALAETVARNTVHEHIRLKYPRRASLQNQLLYIIRHAKGTNGKLHFALWRYEFERLCGFSSWTGQAAELTERHILMRDDPGALARAALLSHHAPTMKLPHLMELVFSWLASPAEFDDMVGATAQLRGVRDVAPLSWSEYGNSDSHETDSSPYEPQDPGLTPEQYTVLRASLRPLWEQIAGLTRTRSASLLLNQADSQGRPVIELLIELGVASLSEIAKVLEFSPQQLATLLPELPLKDKHISDLLGCAPASIAVYRAQARKKLQEIVA